MKIRDLTLRLRTFLARRRSERELDDELTFHLECETQKHVANGVSLSEARTRARASFGPVSLAADECRDARGTAFVDDCVRDITYALRSFRRAPLVAATIVTTVALGLGMVTVVFTIFNIFVFRVDEVRDPNELFAVERSVGTDRVGFTMLDYEALRREANVFSDVFGMALNAETRLDGRRVAGTLVTGNFFQALGVDAVIGRVLTPGDDQPFAGQPVMVLSYRTWSRFFSSDRAIIGRRLLINGFQYEVIGVAPEGFRGLTVGTPDFWAPLSLAGHFRPISAESAPTFGVVGRLKPGLSQETALAGLRVWAAGKTDGSSTDRRAFSIRLRPSRGTIPDPLEAFLLFTPLFFMFGLVLMIGCANVANLLLARAVSRQREIGVRISLGASRQRIVRQLLTESLLLALASAALGFVVSRVAIGAAVYAATSTMGPEIAENVRIGTFAADWRVMVFLVSGAIVSTVFFGLVPALQATRVELVRAVRGEVTKSAVPRRARNILISVQVTASALLLICSAIFLRGALAASTADPGIRTADTVTIQILNESLRNTTVQAVTAERYVTAIAASWPGPAGNRVAFAETASGRSSVAYKFVSPEYFDVLGIAVLRGRGFTQAERTGSTTAVVVSESTARQWWPNGDALGQTLRLDVDSQARPQAAGDPPVPSHTLTVVGVTRDVPGLLDSTKTGLYLPIGVVDAKTTLTVRAQGDPEQARLALITRLTTIDPRIGEIRTLRTLAGLNTYFLQIAFWVTVVLGGLALVLTLSGLFSVVSYLVEQRRKEFSVRMALGATPQNVAGLVISQSAGPVGVGLIAGSGLACGLAIVLMATPVASEIGGNVHVFDPVAYAGSLACITAACVLAALVPALRAGRIDPMRTLRQE